MTKTMNSGALQFTITAPYIVPYSNRNICIIAIAGTFHITIIILLLQLLIIIIHLFAIIIIISNNKKK